MLPLEVTTTTEAVGAGASLAAYTFLMLGWLTIVFVAGWKLYAKTGEAGWVAIVPFLNLFGLLRIVKRPLWWFLLLLIPIVNVVVWVIVLADLSRAFGKGLGMTLVLIFLMPIAYIVLGYGDARYQLPKEPLFG